MGLKIFTRIATLALCAFLLISFAPTASAQRAPDLSDGCFKGFCLGQKLPKKVADALRKKPDDLVEFSGGLLDGLSCMAGCKQGGERHELCKSGRFKHLKCMDVSGKTTEFKYAKRGADIELIDGKVILIEAHHVRHPSSLPTPAKYSSRLVEKYRGRLSATSVDTAAVTLINQSRTIRIEWSSTCPNAKSSSNLGTCLFSLKIDGVELRTRAMQIEKKLRERAKKKSYDDIP